MSRQIRHRPTKNYDEEEDNKGQGGKGELEKQKSGAQGKGRYDTGKGYQAKELEKEQPESSQA